MSETLSLSLMIAGVVVCVALCLIVWACCAVASDADDRSEALQLKSKRAANWEGVSVYHYGDHL